MNDDRDAVENLPQHEEAELAEEWVVRAWRMWTSGVRNWSEIARRVGKDRETVKRNIVKHGQAMATILAQHRPSALAEYVDGCLQDMAWFLRVSMEAERGIPERVNEDGQRIPGHPPNIRLAMSARREVSARRRDVAEALGLVGAIGGTNVQANFLFALGGNNSDGNGTLNPEAIRFMLQRERQGPQAPALPADAGEDGATT